LQPGEQLLQPVDVMQTIGDRLIGQWISVTSRSPTNFSAQAI
jgi:hypothetical protein